MSVASDYFIPHDDQFSLPDMDDNTLGEAFYHPTLDAYEGLQYDSAFEPTDFTSDYPVMYSFGPSYSDLQNDYGASFELMDSPLESSAIFSSPVPDMKLSLSPEPSGDAVTNLVTTYTNQPTPPTLSSRSVATSHPPHLTIIEEDINHLIENVINHCYKHEEDEISSYLHRDLLASYKRKSSDDHDLVGLGSSSKRHKYCTHPSLTIATTADSTITSYGAHLHNLQILLHDEKTYRTLSEQKGTLAQSLLDWLQQLIDAPGISKNLRASICTTMIRISKRNGICPSCLTIKGVTKLGKDPVAGGGFGDIWKGRLGEAAEDQLVCLKVVKVYLMSDMKRLLKDYLREAIIWRQLRHPNLLPCLGLYYLDDSQRICLVSPWMENGNLVEFLRSQPRNAVNRVQLMRDITSGLAHLHALKIVHGDLKGVNVLITRSRRACIADFGLSRVADSQIFKVTSTAAHPGGTSRWTAPEIYKGNPSTTWSDIYSVGCLYYEIITGLVPFHNLQNDAAVILAVLQEQRPLRPDGVISDDFWSLMNDCWSPNPTSRPPAEQLLRRLPDLAPAEDWDTKLFAELQRNVASTMAQHHEALEFLELLGSVI